KRDNELAKAINLNIEADRNLPDIILADLGDGRSEDVLLVFVEVVATDGPISTLRKDEFLKLTRDAQLDDSRVVFVTAYMDREVSALKKTFSVLAWNSFVWLVSEPENIVALYGKVSSRLQALLQG